MNISSRSSTSVTWLLRFRDTQLSVDSGLENASNHASMLCRSSRSIRWNQRSGNTSVPTSRETNESVPLGTLLEWRLLSLAFHSAVVTASDVTTTVAMPMIGLPRPSSTILSELLVDLVLCPLPVTGYLAGSGLPDEGVPGILCSLIRCSWRLAYLPFSQNRRKIRSPATA